MVLGKSTQVLLLRQKGNFWIAFYSIGVFIVERADAREFIFIISIRKYRNYLIFLKSNILACIYIGTLLYVSSLILILHKGMYKFILLATLVLTTYCRFDPDLARNLFYINVATYCRLSSVKDWTCRPCIESKLKLTNVSPFFNSTGDVLGLLGVSKSPEAIILVFRGTDPRGWKNWAQDFNFIKTKFPICTNGCQVHRGFYHAYQQIQAAVTKSVKQYIEKYQINSLIIVGHSLGGALATHAAISLNNQGVSVDQLYTYGSPRVGDVKFSQWFDGYIKTVNKNRVTHGHDPVPHLPPHDFGFTHVPHEIFEVNPRQYVTCTDSGQKQDPNCSDKFKTDTNVIDHGNYCGVDFFTIYASCQ